MIPLQSRRSPRGLRALLLGSLLVGLASVSPGLAAAPGPAAAPLPDQGARHASGGRGRVILLAFDGADPELAARFMAEGALPNLAKLRDRQGFAPLITTFPAQSPVCWSAAVSGKNPGKTGVFDFFMRQPGTLDPVFVLKPAPPRTYPSEGPSFLAALAAAIGFGLLAFVLVRFTGGYPGLPRGDASASASPAASSASPGSNATSAPDGLSPPAPLSLGEGGTAEPPAGVADAAMPDAAATAQPSADSAPADWRAARRAVAARRFVLGLVLAGVVGLIAFVAIAAQGTPALTVPAYENPNRAQPFWSTLAAAGVRTVVTYAPMSYPAKPAPGAWVLCGMTPPDLTGNPQPANFRVFREEPHPGPVPFGGPRSLALLHFSYGVAEATLQGPPDPTAPATNDEGAVTGPGERLSLPMRFTRDGEAGTLTIALGDPVEQTLVLRPGDWSPLTPVAFPTAAGTAVSGMLRFKLEALAPLRLYQSALHPLPQRLLPGSGLATPARAAGTLVSDLLALDPHDPDRGLFPTAGWSLGVMAAASGLVSDQTFFEDCQYHLRRRRQVMLARMAREDWDSFAAFFYGIDRAEHIFWRGLDPGHPLYEKGDAERLTEYLRACYREMDATVGAVRARYPEALVLVISDHGFTGFRKQVSLNTWLSERGYLMLKPEMSFTGGGMMTDGMAKIDWPRTRAFAIGLSGIYLNLKGREPGGIVEPGDAPALVNELALALSDPTDRLLLDGNLSVVDRVKRRDDVYQGPYADAGPDLVVAFRAGYRMSWSTPRGGGEPTVVSDNLLRWSGDHVNGAPYAVETAGVRRAGISSGVLFSSRPLDLAALDRTPARLYDLIPTILRAFGVTPGADLDGQPLPFAPLEARPAPPGEVP